MSIEGDKRETLHGFVGGDKEQKGSVVSRECWNRVWVATHLVKLVGRALELGSRHPSCQEGSDGKWVCSGRMVENVGQLSWKGSGRSRS
jgi:hypothetical protein